MPTLTNNTSFTEGVDTDAIGPSAPTGNIGFEKDSGQTGFFVYSTTEYTLWLKNSSETWTAHQTFTAQNLLVSTTFAWGDYEAAYIQTTSPGHKVFIYPRTGSLLIDSDTSDSINQADTLVTAGTSSNIGIIGAPIEQFPSWSSVNGHIIPNSNADFDIGSAEYKVRHLFLSDNSLWIGNNQKLSVSGGKLKMQNRKAGDVPQFILDAGATPQDFTDYYPGRTAASISLSEWVAFARDFTGDQQLKTTQVITTADFDDAADWEDYLLVDDPVTGELTLKAPDEKTVTLSEIREAIDNKHTFTDHIILKEKRDLHFYDETDSMKGQVAYNENVSGNFIKVGLEADDTKARTISLNAGNTDGISPEGTVKLVGRTLIDRDGSVYDVTDKLDSLEGDIATNTTAIAAIDTSGIATNAAAIADIDANKHIFTRDIKLNDDEGLDFYSDAATTKKVEIRSITAYSNHNSFNIRMLPDGTKVRRLEIDAGSESGNTPEGYINLVGRTIIHRNGSVYDVTDKIDSVEGDIATNTADIATNTADIATNTADIATNTADIATNTAALGNLNLEGLEDLGDIINTNPNGQHSYSRLHLNQGYSPGGIHLSAHRGGSEANIHVNSPSYGSAYAVGDIVLTTYNANDQASLSIFELVGLLRSIKSAVENSTDGDTLRGQLLLAFANWDV